MKDRIRIFREENQFAAAHFLAGMGKCERLHGHNYSVTVELCGEPGPDHAIADFNFINPIIRRLCDSLDHKTLIAGRDARISLDAGDEEAQARFGDKRYVFPKQDVVILDIEATTVERLAAWFCERLAGELAQYKNLEWIEVGVREGAAQMGIHRMPLKTS